MFAPVMVEGRPHIDAGFMDEAGIMALPGVPESKLVVNIVCSRNAITSSVLPEQYKDCRVSVIFYSSVSYIYAKLLLTCIHAYTPSYIIAFVCLYTIYTYNSYAYLYIYIYIYIH